MALRIKTLRATLNHRLDDADPLKPLALAAATIYDEHHRESPTQANSALRLLAEMIKPARGVTASDNANADVLRLIEGVRSEG